jgi:hypothetical protein
VGNAGLDFVGGSGATAPVAARLGGAIRTAWPSSWPTLLEGCGLEYPAVEVCRAMAPCPWALATAGVWP